MVPSVVERGRPTLRLRNGSRFDAGNLRIKNFHGGIVAQEFWSDL